jgi:hypothetical protein
LGKKFLISKLEENDFLNTLMAPKFNLTFFTKIRQLIILSGFFHDVVIFVVASQSLTKNWRKKIAKKQISKVFDPIEVFRPKKESESYPEIKIKSFQLKTISNKFKIEGNTHFNKNHLVKKQQSKIFFDPS